MKTLPHQSSLLNAPAALGVFHGSSFLLKEGRSRSRGGVGRRAHGRRSAGVTSKEAVSQAEQDLKQSCGVRSDSESARGGNDSLWRSGVTSWEKKHGDDPLLTRLLVPVVELVAEDTESRDK